MVIKPFIEQVKQKYEMEWMNLPGVEGVGIIEEKDKKVIVVYCSKQVKEIPPKIEGFRVIKKLTNEFKAF